MLAASRRDIGARKDAARRWALYRNALFGLAWFRDKGDIWRPGAGFGRRSPPITATGRGHPRTHRSGAGHQVLGAAEGVSYLIIDGKVVTPTGAIEKSLSQRDCRIEKASDLWYARRPMISSSMNSACAADSEEAAATTD